MSERRVVITGVGVRSPIGNDAATLVESLRTGRSGVRRAPEWDWVTDLRTRVVGAVEGVDVRDLPRHVRRITGRVGLLAIGALDDAIADAGLSPADVTGEDSWLAVGSTLGALADIESMLVGLRESGSVLGLQTSGALRSMAHTAAVSCALHLEFRGRLLALAAACATGSTCIGMGYEAIRAGTVDVALAGGADEAHVSTAATFDTLRAATTGFNDSPTSTPRPFDTRRDGIVCAEGAGFVVLESWERARARGADVYAEVRGFATGSSGTAATSPDAAAISRCMRGALAQSGLATDAIGYVNAHATGTVAGDSAEASAIGDVVGPRVAVASSKGHMGHTMAAAGAIESIVCLLQMRHGFLHPTLNLESVAEDCACVDHVTSLREVRPAAVANNNFALGGLQTCLVFAPA